MTYRSHGTDTRLAYRFTITPAKKQVGIFTININLRRIGVVSSDLPVIFLS